MNVATKIRSTYTGMRTEVGNPVPVMVLTAGLDGRYEFDRDGRRHHHG